MSKSTCTAFDGEHLLAAGAPWEVAVAVKAALEADTSRRLLTFDDQTGRQLDFDLRGSPAEVESRLKGEGDGPVVRAPGRPKLGVVAREVTLLPRQWEWLSGQPGGASVTLRKLVDAARNAGGDRERMRQAQAAADRFMSAMLGDQPGYEEASRALYAGDRDKFTVRIKAWPADLRRHVAHLAAQAFPAQPDGQPER